MANVSSNFEGATAPMPKKCKICRAEVESYEGVFVPSEDDPEVMASIDYTVHPCEHSWNQVIAHG